MTKPRRKPQTRFHTFIVEPGPNFHPTNWQQTPKHYRILEYVGAEQFLGSADAWKFLHNHGAIRSGNTTRWAIYIDFEKQIFETEPTGVANLDSRTSQVSFNR